MVGENSDNISVLSDGNLTFVLNIIIIIIIILASLPAYCQQAIVMKMKIMVLLVEVAGLW